MKKYILSVGLNDKDTKRQEISTHDAYKIVQDCCYNYTDGATIYEARGVYLHEGGEKVKEVTLRVEMYGGEIEAVKSLIFELKKRLNQESIALEIVECNSVFI